MTPETPEQVAERLYPGRQFSATRDLVVEIIRADREGLKTTLLAQAAEDEADAKRCETEAAKFQGFGGADALRTFAGKLLLGSGA